MKQFLKENIALALGIALPLLLMVVFFIAGKAATISVDNPRYDFLFAVDYYENRADLNQPWSIKITDDKMVISYRPYPVIASAPYYYNKPQIYRFDHEKLRAEQVDIDWNHIVDGKISSPAIDALNKGKLSTATESPDGYIFGDYYSSSGSGIAGDLFGFNRYRGTSYALKKGPRVIPVEGPQAYYNAKFLAWIEE